jgi:hypothetical protein
MGAIGMKVFVGSLLVVILICVGIWLMLSPSFKKVGDTAHKLKQKLEEDENGDSK